MSTFSGGVPRFRTSGREQTAGASKSEKLQKVMAEIDDLVGLAGVKQQLEQLIAYARVITIRRERDLPVGPVNLHMVFAGPPGTGKTEVARKVGRMLSAIGLLRTGRCVEVDKAKLIGTHVGETAQKVTARFNEAKDGVLFIDEAYTIAGIKAGTTSPSPGPYEQEAIDTLLKLMEDNRDCICVIAAGYTNEMRMFVDSNTGLKSRFARFIEFENYNRDELYEIFIGMMSREHYQLASDADRELRQHLQMIFKPNDPSFGNARTVRGLYEKVQMAQAMRLAYSADLETLPNDAFMTFEADDVRIAAQQT
jgi:stage V sporulation protein K